MDNDGLLVMLDGALGPMIGDLFKAGDARDCLVGMSMVKSSLFLLSSMFATGEECSFNQGGFLSSGKAKAIRASSRERLKQIESVY